MRQRSLVRRSALQKEIGYVTSRCRDAQRHEPLGLSAPGAGVVFGCALTDAKGAAQGAVGGRCLS